MMLFLFYTRIPDLCNILIFIGNTCWLQSAPSNSGHPSNNRISSFISNEGVFIGAHLDSGDTKARLNGDTEQNANREKTLMNGFSSYLGVSLRGGGDLHGSGL